eukprot:TRINITY_DN4508_c0_g1_i4.p1 TRINITY_DN4508_c0_g1~~TRINITY_DN4508_c0_g1_i4.p1  ORF type:complete len:451 (-),score=67.56 TRINITY_DN4508_c0_g1_i4:287-1639(-)
MTANNVLSLSVMTQEGEVIPMQIDGTETVANVKMFLEVDSQIPAQQQELMLNGKPLADSSTLIQNGVGNGDLLLVVNKSVLQQQQQQRQQQVQNQQQQSSSANVLEDIFQGIVNERGEVTNAQARIDQIRNNPGMMARLNMVAPKVAEVIRRNDVQQFERIVVEINNYVQRAKQEQELLMADPMDPEVQRRIEEKIHEDQIQQNYEMAMEHHPELFFRTDMLYVKMQINNVDIKAFIDTGAQMSIMTKECAEKVGLLRLMDKRYKGMAMGVGTAEIIGRIHQAPIKIDDQFIPCAITVLSQKTGPEFIFGLDMLKQHLCSVDLQHNVLRFTSINVELPFLTGDDLPSITQELERQQSRDITSGIPKVASGAPPGPTPKPSQPTSSGTGQPPQTQPQQANTGQANIGQSLEEKLQQLMGLGFGRQECVQALQMTGGDVDQAAAVLFQAQGL